MGPNPGPNRGPISRNMAILIIACSALVGCGSGSEFPLAEVSGKVTLNGNPVPKSDGKNPNSGPYSVGVTDANGIYHLETRYGNPGAVVGTHRVVLEMVGVDSEAEAAKNDELTPPGVPPKSANPIPNQWGLNSEMEMQVPAEGTATADIELAS